MITFKIDLDGYCTEVSEEALQFFGYTEESEVLSRDLHAKIHHLTESGQKHEFANCDLFYALRFKQSYTIAHVRFWKSNGDSFFADMHIEPILNSGVLVGAKLQLTTLDDAKQTRRHRLKRLAFYDSLTSLPNRETLFDRSTSILQTASYGSTCCALLFLDLDHFKAVNDTYGHAVGDSLLCRISQRLQSCVRRTDLVARIGGDEFIILLANLKDASEADLVAKKILQISEDPYHLGEVMLTSSLSIGISIHSGEVDSTTLPALINEADVAMYTSKRAGKNQFCRFSNSMNHSLERHLAIERELREELLAPTSLYLEFQPIVNIEEYRVVGVESLVRWNSKSFGLVSPTELIHVAENSGLISQLDDWVFAEALQFLKSWEGTTLSNIWLSVNISATHLQSASFLSQFKRRIESIGVDITKFRVEIDTSNLVVPTKRLSSILAELSDTGVSLILDNFGIGAISLRQLYTLPISMLKVDRKFICSACANDEFDQVESSVVLDKDNRQNLTLIEILTKMSSLFNFSTLIVGIETSIGIEFAQSLNCQYVQGYYVSPPLSLDKLQSFVTDSSAVDLNSASNCLEIENEAI